METVGPSWQTILSVCGSIITLLIGIVVALVGAYAKGLGTRIQTLESNHKALNDSVLSQYHNKNEINGLLQEIKTQVQSLHNRFDILLSQHHKE